MATQLNHTEFEIVYNIFNESCLDKSVAKAKTKHVSINPKTRKRTPLSPSMNQWLDNNNPKA